MIRRATPEDLPSILEIRRVVFIEGQEVPEHEERDGKDADALHLIAFHDDTPVGTARLLLQGDTGKIGRVAVLDVARGLGLGKALMEMAADVLREEGATNATLAAQDHAIGFYEALGYVAFGEEFMDAGIPHRNMSKRL